MERKHTKITYRDFADALRHNGIEPDSHYTYWCDQLLLWNSGVRDARMHDNALSTLAELASE